MTFRSKVDTWLGVALIGSVALSFTVACVVLLQGMPGGAWLAIAVATTGAVLPLWILVDTQYVIDNRILLVRSGPFRWRIPLNEIRSIEPTRNPLSSPALSLDRLRIVYGKNRACMVSPSDREGFIAEIERRANRVG